MTDRIYNWLAYYTPIPIASMLDSRRGRRWVVRVGHHHLPASRWRTTTAPDREHFRPEPPEACPSCGGDLLTDSKDLDIGSVYASETIARCQACGWTLRWSRVDYSAIKGTA